MNLSEAIRNGDRAAVAFVEQAESPSPTVEKLAAQRQSDWMRNMRTQEVFKEIGEEIHKLETEARTLAVQFQQHQNPYGVIQRLIRADALRVILDKYGKLNT